jgi:hypothetical protein
MAGMKPIKTRSPVASTEPTAAATFELQLATIRRGVENEGQKYRHEFLMWLAENVAPPEQASAMLAFLEITLDWCVDTLGEEEGRRFVESVYGRVAAKRRPPLQ